MLIINEFLFDGYSIEHNYYTRQMHSMVGVNLI